MRLFAIIALVVAGIAGGFYSGQTYGQLQTACAIVYGVYDLQGVTLCAGGPRNLARYVLTRDAGE